MTNPISVCLPTQNPLIQQSLLTLAIGPNVLIIKQIRQGISAISVRNLLTTTGMQTTHLAKALSITPLALSRRLRQTGYIFKNKDAATVIRVAKVFTHAVQVFETPERACRWLEAPNPTLLGTEMPISLLDTEFGAELVTEALHRIEHGIFA